MKAPGNNNANRKSAGLNHPGVVVLLIALVVFAGLAYLAGKCLRTRLPAAATPTRVVRGEKIDAPTATTVSGADTNALAILSNSVAATANMASRPKIVNVDSNSLPQTVERDGKSYLNLTFATLASFRFKVTPEMTDPDASPMVAYASFRGQFPLSVLEAAEQRAAVTGFMLPVHVENGLTTDFLLLRNQSACCYGVMPRVNEWVVVHMTGKAMRAFMDVPITAFGTFHVSEMYENRQLTGIYQMDCDGIDFAKIAP